MKAYDWFVGEKSSSESPLRKQMTTFQIE